MQGEDLMRGMARLELVRLAQAVAAAMFERLTRLTPSAIEKARNKAFEVIRKADPTTGTASHAFAAYSHGIAMLAAEGVALAERAWVPAKEIARSQIVKSLRRAARIIDLSKTARRAAPSLME